MKPVCCMLFLAVFSLIVAESCTKNKGTGQLDKKLLDEAMLGGFEYYQSGALLSGAAPSPHGSFKLRFNKVAAAVLDSSGELPVGESFPEGSFLVKEVYENGGLNLYSIMKKSSADPQSANGWIWAEIKPNGEAAVGAEYRGRSCITCHSGSPNRDMVRTFDLH